MSNRISQSFFAWVAAFAWIAQSLAAADPEQDAPLLHFPLSEPAEDEVSGQGRLGSTGRVVDGYWSETEVGPVLSFNGHTTRIEVAHRPQLNLANQMTITAWVRLIDRFGARSILSKGRNARSGYGASIVNGRPKFAAYVRTDNGYRNVRVMDDALIESNRWYHYAATFDARRGQVTFHLDGEKVGSHATPRGTISYEPPRDDFEYGTLPVTISGIATFPAIHYQWHGFLRDVRLYDRILSDQEIARLHASDQSIRAAEPRTAEQAERDRFTARLGARILDAARNEPTPARVSLRDGKGRYFFPADGFRYGDASGGHFYAFGEFDMALPAGEYELVVRKGFEYEPARRSVRIEAGQARELDIALDRWVDLQSKGWYSGDDELQARGHTEKPYDRRLTGENVGNSWRIFMAEGLNWFHLVRGGTSQKTVRPGPQALGGAGREIGSRVLGDVIALHTDPDHEGPLAQLDMLAEVKTAQGAATFSENYEPNMHRPVLMTAARGLPVAVALGRAHLWRYAFKGANPVGYRFLNLGFPMSATGGTDTYINNPADKISPGAYRTYTQLDELSWKEVQKAYRNQRLFVSQGPYVLLRIDGLSHGDTVELGEPASVGIRIEAGHYYGLERVELVHNGEVVETWRFDGERDASVETEQPIAASGWYAARCWGKQGEHFGQWAHTAPIYVEIEGREQKISVEDATFFVAWINDTLAALEGLKERQGWSDQAYEAYVQQARQAQAVYRNLAAGAEQ